MNRMIPDTLFLQSAQYVFMDNPPDSLRQQCMDGMAEQINRIATNNLYRMSKTAKTQAEREEALIKWYDAKGIPQAYRRITKKGEA